MQPAINNNLDGYMSKTAILCFILGWQGGTVHQVAETLEVSTGDILDASDRELGDLCRKAQAVKWQWHTTELNRVMYKHLGVCIDALERDYNGHECPPWLERAKGVRKICAEYF